MKRDALSVSVVIPCYNGVHELGKTIEALLNQTLLPSEIIVVDDGSTDGSYQIAAAYGGTVKVMRQENSGAAVTRRQGVLASDGDIIVFNDTGDISRPNRLRRLHDALTAHPECVAAYGVTRTQSDARDAVSFETGLTLDGGIHVINDVLNRYLRQCWPLAVGMNLAVRREHARKCIDIPSIFKAANDYAFQIRLAAEGPFAKVEDVLLDYEATTGGISARFGFVRQRAFALIAAAQVFEEKRSQEQVDIEGFKNRVDIEWPDILLGLFLMKDSSLKKAIAGIGFKHGRWSRIPSRVWWAFDKAEESGRLHDHEGIAAVVRVLRGLR